MALGIETNGHIKTYAIPLFGLNDQNWTDNTWICEHLRNLADKIEYDNLKIYSVSLEFDKQYKSPQLQINVLV